MKKQIYILIILSLLGFSFRFNSEAEEYKLKAAFIYNFTMYVEWSPPVSENEFIIGVINSSPINKHLEEIANSEKVNGKKIVIRRYDKLEDIGFCHILFIPQNCGLSLNDIIVDPDLKRTLTISEKEEYAKKGTAINFVEVDNKLKFEVNMNTLHSAGIKASSQLLKLAIIINS